MGSNAVVEASPLSSPGETVNPGWGVPITQKLAWFNPKWALRFQVFGFSGWEVFGL